MPQAVDSPAILDQLIERVRDLERRMGAMEELLRNSTVSQTESPPLRYALPATPPPRHLPTIETPAGALSIIGKAVLAVAGAYLLRAITESGTIPKTPVLIAAILYPGFWMVHAARCHASSRFSSATYAITSALILSPLLWESTVSFGIIPTSCAAAVLVSFAVLALGVAWKRNLQLIPSVAITASLATAWALIIATHSLETLLIALLAVAFATESAVCLGRQVDLRGLPAIAVDLAVLLLIYLTTWAEHAEEYPVIGSRTIGILCVAPVVIYGSVVGIRSLALRQPMTVFEIAQSVIAFALAVLGVMRSSRGADSVLLGAFCVLLSAVFYWGALWRFGGEAQARNRVVSAMFAPLLLLGASSLLFSSKLSVLFMSVAAIAAILAYTRTRKLSLSLHASLYLASGAAISSLPLYTVNSLAGVVPAAPEWDVWVVVITAALCYPIGARVAGDRLARLLGIVPAALVGFAAAALAVVAIVFFVSGHLVLDAPRLSVIRTAVNCGLALALAFLGSRLKHPELRWIAYAAVAFGTLKLLFEDLRFGNSASLVVSFLFYGLVLTLLPRLASDSSNAVGEKLP
jgi:hypothetical protein